jgi:hypothetical protein
VTREVMGAEPTQSTTAGPDIDFDLGELRHVPTRPEAMPREPLTVRLAAWRTRRTHWWRAVVMMLAIALVAGFAGWHVGGDRSQAQSEAWTSANPALVGWVVDNGPAITSARDDPREDIELHLFNVGRDPVLIRSISATSDGAPVQVDFNSYTPSRVPTGGTTIAALVLRTSCSTEYAQASLGVRLTRYDAQGDQHATLLTVASNPSLGESMSEVLNSLCANPTRDDAATGVDGLAIEQTSGASGATVALTNNSAGVRQVEITSDESSTFQLITSHPGPVLIRPGQTVDLRLGVHVLTCTAVVGLQDWASSLTLEVSSPGGSFEGTANGGALVNYPLPDVILVPGGAAIQKICNP